ncbi:hypothetical protein [Enterococcus faecalis]|uniref:hypothetical protein n=1 Tax=Enterococcus faecalis TaxID=1351 RepID=UPI0015739C75|nr:hypothetical protein [Enterococcus faecalis]MDK7960384.1 hypothetical protein [Enterococcus faecalis]NSV33456.1 hypothetical protein [Enterococcus faecalis]UYY19352.1 hypothetical protein OLM03_11320 [Enterococcus faecalis]UYY21923.1 hypothetical protein OLM07_11280 [Enterococcus faecalis]HAP2802732.1 hypothetical protein [Enterococcus faecalis]
MNTDERTVIALESIANSLSTLAEDTKAKNRYKESLFVQAFIFILGIAVGCMLIQLGTDLWKCLMI